MPNMLAAVALGMDDGRRGTDFGRSRTLFTQGRRGRQLEIGRAA